MSFFFFHLIVLRFFCFLLEDAELKDMKSAKLTPFKRGNVFLYVLPFFLPNTLGYIVDHGENGSPWRLACLSGHAEHPKNTVQDSGVSLVTTGRKCRPTSSFHYFLSRHLFSFSPLSTPYTTEIEDYFGGFCLGKDQQPTAGIPNYVRISFR